MVGDIGTTRCTCTSVICITSESESWSPHSQLVSNSDLQAKFGLIFNLGLVTVENYRPNFTSQTCGYTNVWRTHPNLSSGPNERG